ncbi:MAG: photosynthetic complex putative assembly protein PuhB [Notoacmeibacter sp.]
MSETGGPEHEIEPVPGLPGRLPDGEYIVWQGRPEAKIVMTRLLRARWIAGYFAIAALWSVAVGINNSEALWALFGRVVFIAVAAVIVFALMAFYARAIAKTSLYTLTNKRIVMRVGIALSASFNLPFKQISGADFRVGADGAGDVALTLKPGHGLSGAVFFPHQRGGLWRKLSPQMMCLPDARHVAETLAEQMRAYAPTPQETEAKSSGSVILDMEPPLKNSSGKARPMRVVRDQLLRAPG